MPEPTVPVPVSLIEQIDRDLGENAWHPEDCPGNHPAYCTCAVGVARRALRALLSQPNSTATPPSIADMVPGTTFAADLLDDRIDEPRTGRTWRVQDDPGVVWNDERNFGVRIRRIDPSTIRDVTRPKESS